MNRSAHVSRHTRETRIELELNLDGSGRSEIATGIGFLDHMLDLLAKHGFFDLKVEIKGDLEVDAHHTVEDLGLVLGDAINRALGDRAGIRRYGSMLLPMDETLAEVVLDLSNRPYLVYHVEAPAPYIRELDVQLFHEFFQALAVKAGMNLHINLRYSEEVHHAFEAIFKAFARALAVAASEDPRLEGRVMSSKGCL